MDYVDTANTNVLSPDTLTVANLRNMLKHIESEWSWTMHLPISSDNTLHFYWYLCTHVRIADGKIMLFINVPILNKACQHANRQFCRINALFQPLANPPPCVTALYAKNNQAVKEQCSLVISHMPHTLYLLLLLHTSGLFPQTPQTLWLTMPIICPDKATSTVHLQQLFNILRLSPACSATSRYFHMPPCYKDHSVVMNVNILAEIGSHPTYRSWQLSLKCQSHSFIEVWSTTVNLFNHLPSRITETHPSYGQS